MGLNRPRKRNAFTLEMLAELSRAYGLLESDDDLADLEPGEPFGRLLLHRYILDARPPRTGLQEPKDALHSLSWTLQGRLEGAVGAVRGPATDAVSLGALADRVAKEDALHTAVDDCPPPDLIVHLRILAASERSRCTGMLAADRLRSAARIRVGAGEQGVMSVRSRRAPKTFEQLVLDFLADLELKRGLARNTVDAYRGDLHQFGAFLAHRGRDALAVEPAELAAFLAQCSGPCQEPQSSVL